MCFKSISICTSYDPSYEDNEKLPFPGPGKHEQAFKWTDVKRRQIMANHHKCLSVDDLKSFVSVLAIDMCPNFTNKYPSLKPSTLMVLEVATSPGFTYL